MMIKEIYEDLKKNINAPNNVILAKVHPSINNHRIGIDSDKYPLILLYSNDNNENHYLPRKLKYLDIVYNQNCEIKEESGLISHLKFTIVKLKSDDDYIQMMFFKLIQYFIETIGNTPTLEVIHKNLSKLFSIFVKLSSPAHTTIQGLFSELLIINESLNPDEMIKYWHNETNDRIDFYNTEISLEVKSTLKEQRVHRFSQNQLLEEDNNFVASILIARTNGGQNIFKLIKLIELRIKEFENRIKLNQLIISSLGDSFEVAKEFEFDYQYSVDSLRIYRTMEIPKISNDDIESSITNIHYDVDLTNVNFIQKNEYINFIELLK